MTDTIVQILVFFVNGNRYGLDVARVRRVVRAVYVTPLPTSVNIVLGVIDLHGQITPVLDLRVRLGAPRRDVDANDQFIIAMTSTRMVALVVDGIDTLVERSASHISACAPDLSEAGQIDGIVHLDDGLALIYDLDALLSLEEEETLAQAMKAEELTHGK